MNVVSLSTFVLSLYSTLYFYDVAALMCYNCSVYDVENDCNTTITCDGPNMGCRLSRLLISYSHQVKFTSGCYDMKECENDVSTLRRVFETVYIGKKRDAIYEAPSGRCILSCCTTDLCNNGCHKSTNRS